MSTPQVIRCECGEWFTFIRGMVEHCRACNLEYKSHRDLIKKKTDDSCLKETIKSITDDYKVVNGIK